MVRARTVLAEQIKAEARRLGFASVGIAPATPPSTHDHYQTWIESGYHGQMAYLARPDAVAKRGDMTRLLPEIRSVVVVAANYHTSPLPSWLRDDPSRGIVASYAWGDDYHDLLVPRLQSLATSVQALAAARRGDPVTYRAYVDTGPVLERNLGVRAGLGFVGKNTNLIHPRTGSWLLLGELLLTLDLPVTDAGAAQVNCGRCTRCLDACPTGALVAPYILDARHCISYLTVELKGPIPRHLRPLIGNRIFGCDICQEVCPWNRRFSQPTAEPNFQARPDAAAASLLDLVALDDAGFRQRFKDSPVKRTKRRGLLRNVAVALGNWGDPSAIPALTRALHDAEPLIRGHAAWALGRTGTTSAQQVLLQSLTQESDDWVREEMRQALVDSNPIEQAVV